MNRRLKVIYVCPFAHYSGHHPHAATVEPKALSKAGIEVKLLTFCGVTNNPDVGVEHLTVMDNNGILKLLRRNTLVRWFLMLGETVLTLQKAIKLKKEFDYDIIHIRDGEPFLWVSHLLGLPHHNLKWVVSLTAANLVAPNMPLSGLFKSPFLTFYTVVMNIVINNKLWKLLYRWSLRRNQFTFTPQNERAKQGYEEYMDGVLSGHIVCVPWGIDGNNRLIPKCEAREHLGLPQDKLILLSFGAPHSGKDMETMFRAMAQMPDVFIVHAGIQAFSLGSSPSALIEKYGLGNRAKVFDYYVREEEKQYFFGASDGIILSYTKIFKSTSSMLWEAAKYQLPVISSNANTLGEDVRKYKLGLLFDAEDAGSLRDAIARFMELPDAERAGFRENGGKFVKRFSEKNWARNYMSVYRGLMG